MSDKSDNEIFDNDVTCGTDNPVLPDESSELPPARLSPLDDASPVLPIPGEDGFSVGAAPIPEVFQPEDDPDAPALPFSAAELRLHNDESAAQSIAALKRLAAGDPRTPEAAQQALVAALQNQPYDATALPDAQALMIGIGRVLLAHGIALDDLVCAVMDAVNER